MADKTLKLVHFADLHLGVETYGRLDPETGFSSRMVDILSALDSLVDYAINHGIHLVLFCGDAYKDRSPNPTQQRELARRIKRLSENNIATFMLTGNHDLPNALNRATATEIFDTLEVDNVHVVSKPGLEQINTSAGPLQILSLPWLRRSNLMKMEDVKNLDMASLFQKMEEVLTKVIIQNHARLNPSIPAVLASHVWVEGARTGSEKGSTIGREPHLMLSNLVQPGIDYVALGHIHRRQILSENPPVVYPGSLVKLDFSDSDDEKGFFVVEITTRDDGTRSTSYRFEPLPGRRFLTISSEVKDTDSDPTQTILDTINRFSSELDNAIVRLEITIPQEAEGLLRDSEIRAALKTAHYTTIAKKVTRHVRSRLGSGISAEAITPFDALQAWLDISPFSPEKKGKLLQYGTSLIEEVTGQIKQ
ncbi:MAG: exonuclease SbcCD subunit D [Dehalococcoidales bacterium]|jgi:exonuclease SbcD|nr:exonuclease SbcCD subunit D [Dehalococcoidales bacterium]MDD3264319.1 exonuclease SbcCD subunit D [Dehalococcoidales bacterium]MDD4322060.1 exonuclease SbcCD subunit D [Dehalococcoidales bacterium]MDD4793631.1 exonuclease SbcCD subunit D [Dehalococcoidales bacterium]MDD5122006.1 exonuclease SbcCD subunit D [Dehalococcoidales bacterium]